MFRMHMFLLTALFLVGAGLWAADAVPAEKGKTTETPKVTKAPEKVLPMGALVFAIRPTGAMVMVNRLPVPAMSPWMVGQELLTGTDQYAHLLLADRTVMTLGPKSNAVLQQEPVLATGANKSTIQLRKGSLQVVTSKLAVENGFSVNTLVGDAVAVGTDYNVEVSTADGVDNALIRVKTGLVNFQMNGQTFPIKEGERRLFSKPSHADDAEAMTVRDLESQLDLLVEDAKKIKDEELRGLLARTVSVNVLVKTGRVDFRVNEQAYGIRAGEKRIVVQPGTVFDPEALTAADYEVMLKLLEELAKKVKDEELGLKTSEKVLPTGALIFEIEADGEKDPKVLVDSVPVPQMTTWEVGQEILTGDKQYAHLILADRTVMTLGPKSRAVLQQTPVAATGANATTVHLREGSLRVSTSKIATHNGFLVSTPLGEAVAQGTDFYVQVLFGGLPPRVIPNVVSGGGSNIIPPPVSP